MGDTDLVCVWCRRPPERGLEANPAVEWSRACEAWTSGLASSRYQQLPGLVLTNNKINKFQDSLRAFLVLVLADGTASEVRRRFPLTEVDVGPLPLRDTVMCHFQLARS